VRDRWVILYILRDDPLQIGEPQKSELVCDCWEKFLGIPARFVPTFKKKAPTKATVFFQILAKCLSNCRFACTSRAVEPKDATARVIFGGPVPQLFEYPRSSLLVASWLWVSLGRVVESVVC
jgi:hypothetical protein